MRGPPPARLQPRPPRRLIPIPTTSTRPHVLVSGLPHSPRGDLRLTPDARALRPGDRPSLPMASSDRGPVSIALGRSLTVSRRGYRLTRTPRVHPRSETGRHPPGSQTRGSCSLLNLPSCAVEGCILCIPSVAIADRQLRVARSHLDVARHFMPKGSSQAHSLPALHKFNVFHWHLTEDHAGHRDQKFRAHQRGAFPDSMTAPRARTRRLASRGPRTAASTHGLVREWCVTGGARITRRRR